jgi:hypothetical protein
MTGFLVLILQGTSYQILIGMLVTVLYEKIYSHYSPFIDASIASLKEIVQWQIFIALMLAFLIQTDALGESRLLIYVMSVFAVFMCMLYDVCKFVLSVFIPVKSSGHEVQVCSTNKDQNGSVSSIGGMSVRVSDVILANPMSAIDRDSGVRMSTPRNYTFKVEAIDKNVL